MKKRICLILACITLGACNHPIEIIGQGDVMSASGDRDCLLEDYQAQTGNCTENLVADAYLETYYATPKAGYLFSAWGNYCTHAQASDECHFDIPAQLVTDANLEEVPPLVAYFRKEVTEGYNALLMGHSFFFPFYQTLNDQSQQAGFNNHRQTVFYAGGEHGAPYSFWENTRGDKAQIQMAMDEGNLSLLGMTYFPHEDLEYNLQGYRNWINYALRNNSDFTVFIGMPWGTYPGSTSIDTYISLWNTHHEDIVHAFIDQLRQEFPQLDIYCLPYGQLGIELRKAYDNGQLPEIQALIGNYNNSLFIDELGHSGRIMRELGALIWLRAIYGVDLLEFPNQSNYSINLNELAQKILNRHDHRYDAS